MGDMLDMFGDGAGVHFELIDEMGLTLVVYGSDENPASLIMDMSARIIFEGEVFDELDGEEMTIRMSVEYTYTAFGDDVVITTPPIGPAMSGFDDDFFADIDDFDCLFDEDFNFSYGDEDDFLDDFDLAEELFGIWDWDQDDAYSVVFYPDGTGTRGFAEELESFDWITAGDYLFIGFEHWAFTIEGGVLTIDSQQVPGVTYSYIAR